MIDTHMHVVPGADDGAADMAQAIAVVKAAAEAGTTSAIAIIHATGPECPDRATASALLSALQAELRCRGLELALTLGYEVDLLWACTLEVDDLLEYSVGEDRRVLILEAPHVGWPRGSEELVFRLRLQGVIPVLAHPERNPHIQSRPDVLGALVRQGAVAQITAPSVMGAFGGTARRAALRHLLRGEVALLASDAHYHRRERSNLRGAVARLRQIMPNASVELLVGRNASLLLNGVAPKPVAGPRGVSSVRARLRSLAW